MTAFRELFTPHGSFTIEVSKRRLLVDAIGPFNFESVNQYKSALEDAINRLKGNRWTQIIVLHGMSMLTPDAEKQLEEVIRFRMRLGLLASVVVLGDVEGKGLVSQQMQRLYERVGLNYAFTDTTEQAMQWLDDWEASCNILEA